MPIEVVKPGLLTTLQDTGRAGLAHLGIGRAGAFDVPALRLANALCGNPAAACTLEITLLGPTLRLDCAAWIAVTGASIPFRIDGIDQPMWAPVCVPAGATIGFGAMRSGCRSYLAVRGGFDIAPVLGSRSMDVNARLGPFNGRPLRAGDALAIASIPDASAGILRTSTKWRLDPRPWYPDDAATPLRLVPGAQLDSLSEMSRKRLFSELFVVQKNSNRVGLRVAGPALEFCESVEMVSEACVPGLLQLPPSGQPIVFGPEGPVSGGYPRLGQVAVADLPRLAQLRPGDGVRFRPCTFAESLAALGERERALARLESTIAHRLSP